MMKKIKIILSTALIISLSATIGAKEYTDAPQISESGSTHYSSIAHEINLWKTTVTSAVDSRSAIMDQVENCVNWSAQDFITDAEYENLAGALYWWLSQVVEEGRLLSEGTRIGWNIRNIYINDSFFSGNRQCVWRLVRPNVSYRSGSSYINVPNGSRLVIFVSDYECKPGDESGSEHIITDVPMTYCNIDSPSGGPNHILRTSEGGKIILFGKQNHPITIKGNKTWEKSTSYEEVLARKSSSDTGRGQLAFIGGGSLLTGYTTFKNNFPSYSACVNCGERKGGGAIALTGKLGVCSFYRTAINDNAISYGFGAGVCLLNVTGISGDGIFFNKCEFNGNIVIGGSDTSDGAHGGAVGGYFDGTSDTKKIYFKSTTFTNNCQASGYEAHGGAIFYRDTGRGCVIDNCVFDGNYAHGATAGGGAISNEGNLSVTNTSFTNNYAANSFGGAIHVRPVNDADVTKKVVALNLSNCSFIGNKCTWTNNSTATGETLDIQSADIERGSGGAILIDIFRGYNDSDATNYSCTLSLDDNCVFEDNHADRNGGAVSIVLMKTMKNWISSHSDRVISDLSLNSAIFSGNTAGAEKTWKPSGSIYNQGGAIYLLYTSLNITSDAVSLSNNSALFDGGKGGGAAIYNGTLVMNGGHIGTAKIGNKALAGGGAYIQGGSFTLTRGSIENNKSTESNSGGILVNGGNLTISNGTIIGNESAGDGGAFAVSGGDILISNGVIENNTANGNGGAVYATGGNITITGGTISNNKALISGTSGGNGGAFYVSSSDNTKKVSITQGSIKGNTAQKSGGAFCITKGIVEITYGSVNENVAVEDGGALYASGGKIYFNREGIHYGSIIGNEARNGGGLFLTDGAYMQIQEALITNNHAIASQTINTAYHSDVSLSGNAVQGMGGGVYVTKGAGSAASERTTLKFLREDEVVCLGIYGNIADNGGDEILSDGNNTAIYIPETTDMQLSVFGGYSQGWFEDFVNNDTAYLDDSKTDVIRASDGYPVRYRDQVLSGKKTFKYNADLSVAETRYACLALGSAVGTLTIKKTGLKAGESSIFKASRTGYPDRTAILTGTGSGNTVTTTLKNIDVGEWVVTETPWSWGYTPDQQSQAIIIYGGTLATEDKNTVTFNNTEKSENPKHAEAIKENNFSNEGSMTIKMGQDVL